MEICHSRPRPHLTFALDVPPHLLYSDECRVEVQGGNVQRVTNFGGSSSCVAHFPRAGARTSNEGCSVLHTYMAQALACAILGQMAQGNPHLTSYGEQHGAEAKSDQCWQQLCCEAKCSRLMKVALSYILAHSYGVSPLSKCMGSKE